MPSVGDTHEAQLVDDLTRTQIVQYAGASGDYNPLHSDEPFVTKIAGYPTVFAHGMLTMGMTGRALTEWLGADALRSFGVRFSKQVWPGDTLTATFTVTGAQDEGTLELAVSVRNQDGDEVLVGTATAAA
jgi:acyl dehydratase